MRKLRFGGYEIHRIDRFNIGVFRAVPEGGDAPKGNVIRRISDDGTPLYHIGKYYGSYEEAARALHSMLLAEGIEDAACASVADAIERAQDAFRSVADAVEEIGRSADVRG